MIIIELHSEIYDPALSIPVSDQILNARVQNCQGLYTSITGQYGFTINTPVQGKLEIYAQSNEQATNYSSEE